MASVMVTLKYKFHGEEGVVRDACSVLREGASS